MGNQLHGADHARSMTECNTPASFVKNVKPPVSLPSIAFDLIWHRRNNAHPAQQWLRSLIAEVASS
jgi:hypothetical protein